MFVSEEVGKNKAIVIDVLLSAFSRNFLVETGVFQRRKGLNHYIFPSYLVEHSKPRQRIKVGKIFTSREKHTKCNGACSSSLSDWIETLNGATLIPIFVIYPVND